MARDAKERLEVKRFLWHSFLSFGEQAYCVAKYKILMDIQEYVPLSCPISFPELNTILDEMVGEKTIEQNRILRNPYEQEGE